MKDNSTWQNLERRESPTSTRAVTRALDVLQCFVGNDEIRVTDISRELGLSMSTVHRLLGTLQAEGYVAANPKTRHYTVGFRLLQLASSILRQQNLGINAADHLHALRDETGETSCLHVRSGLARVCILEVESQHELRWVMTVGRQLPLYAGAVGKVLMAGMTPSELDHLFSVTMLKALTPSTITDPDRLRQEIELTRRRGFGVSVEERAEGAVAAAAPVRSATGDVVAVVSIYGPTVRLSQGQLAALAPKVVACANRISQEIGYSAMPQRDLERSTRTA